jgi:hypothetical protein
MTSRYEELVARGATVAVGVVPVGTDGLWVSSNTDSELATGEFEAFSKRLGEIVEALLGPHVDDPYSAAFVRGDNYHERTEWIIPDEDAIGGRADVLAALVRGVQRFLVDERWTTWRVAVVMPRDPDKHVLVYPQAVMGEARWPDGELEARLAEYDALE